MRIFLIILLFFYFGSINTYAQIFQKLSFIDGIKVGVNFANQSYQGIPIIWDEEVIFGGGQYNRIGPNFQLFNHLDLNPKFSLETGLEYRQRGFLSDDKIIDDTVRIQLDSNGEIIYNNNRMDYIYGDIQIKYRFGRGKKVNFSLSWGNRIDYLISYNTPFYTERYRSFQKLEFSPFGAFGLNFLKFKKFKPSIEFEYNPGLMDIFIDGFNPPFISVKNSSFGFVISIRKN